MMQDEPRFLSSARSPPFPASGAGKDNKQTNKQQANNKLTNKVKRQAKNNLIRYFS